MTTTPADQQAEARRGARIETEAWHRLARLARLTKNQEKTR